MEIKKTSNRGSLSTLLLLAVLVSAGCDKGEATGPKDQPKAGAPTDQVAGHPKSAATQPLIPVAQLVDWCREHGMPESICVQCNTSLTAGFKEKGDWDEEHGLPKSQCFKCDPSLKQTFAAAFKDKYGKEPPAMEVEKE